jgi:hypothetical protein
MKIYPFDKTAEDIFTPQDLSNIQSEGITIRSGSKILKFRVTEETALPDDVAYRKELEAKFSQAHNVLKSELEEYKNQMKVSLDKEKQKLAQSQAELDRRINAVSVLPALTESHLNLGLSVAITDGSSRNNRNGGLVWSFKTVYAPKMVGNRRIEPDYAKRLVTPVVIVVRTDKDSKVHSVVVNQYIGNNKFHHYHSMSNSSDCWGQFHYSGKVINNPNDMITFCREAAFLLEVINDMSIGTRNPRGLSRFETLSKHLLPVDAGVPEGNARSNTTNSRNERSGVNPEAISNDNVWSV